MVSDSVLKLSFSEQPDFQLIAIQLHHGEGSATLGIMSMCLRIKDGKDSCDSWSLLVCLHVYCSIVYFKTGSSVFRVTLSHMILILINLLTS